MRESLRKAKPYIVIALVDAFATQIFIDLFSNNFRISVAVLILPVIYIFNRKINPIVASIYIGLIGMFFRTFIGVTEFGTFTLALLADYQIIFFDITYGLTYYFLLYKKKDYDITQWLLVVLFADMFSNIIEILSRTGFQNIAVFSDQIYILFYVAIFRTLVALITVLIIKSYRMFLLKNEHNNRYQTLLLRISDLESELYFINRNMEHIEDVMFDSYDLYDGIDTMDQDEIKSKSLNIAKNIHEIKKNYVNIYNGIKEITDKDKDDNELKIFDLLNILFKNLNRLSNMNSISLKYHVKSNFVIHESYYFISIIRNIVINAIESLNSSKQKIKHIDLYEISNEECYIYKIVDNGPGISNTQINEIFEAGFSTKFDNESGDSNRGLGLYIVKELIETIYEGELFVVSTPNVSTEFTVSIPKNKIEVKYENLHIG